MIRADHNKYALKFSNCYTRILIGLFFGKLNYSGDYEEKGLPILMISNHFSFYDGFIQILLNLKVFKRRFHWMMLEEQLRKNILLTKIGASSIDKGKRSSLQSLAYAVEVLQDKENLFLFFPQGKIKSMYTRDFTFEKGLLTYILKNMRNDFQLVFNINLLDYGDRLRPELCVYYKTHHINSDTNTEAIEKAFNIFAQACFAKQGVQ